MVQKKVTQKTVQKTVHKTTKVFCKIKKWFSAHPGYTTGLTWFAAGIVLAAFHSAIRGVERS